MYLYETHLHTAPVSRCGRRSVRDCLTFYKQIGYDGVFITNHFIDGNINMDASVPYAERIHFYFSDYEEGEKIGKELGIKVFCGVEMSNGGTDFLVYGLDKQWYLDHEELQQMPYSARLTYLKENGALIIQAHPYREAGYIDHIRLFPRHVEGVEIFNAGTQELANKMAEHYAAMYQLQPFAGSDNHVAEDQKMLGGIRCQTPISDMADFIQKFRNHACTPFVKENPLLAVNP
ncbi:MAG: hypothetical protein IIX10_04055 [Clostridia bacterium]|nr:hypothetical protein [Clostridia bacterium]